LTEGKNYAPGSLWEKKGKKKNYCPGKEERGEIKKGESRPGGVQVVKEKTELARTKRSRRKNTERPKRKILNPLKFLNKMQGKKGGVERAKGQERTK